MADKGENKIKVSNGYLKPGDMVAVKRKGGLYEHFCIYLGNGMVVHFSGDKYNSKDEKVGNGLGADAFIQLTNFGNFMNGQKNDTARIVRVKKPLDPAETIRRAKSLVGKGKGTYSLKYNNCETIAYWCKTGNVSSQQVNEITNKVSNAASKVAKVALGANKTIQKYGSKSSIDKVSKAVHDAIQNKIHGTTNKYHEKMEYFQ